MAALALVVAGAVPASAAGTGGIEVSPYPGIVDGHQVTAFHATVPGSGEGKVAWSLRNTTGAVATGRLYAAAATSDGHGGWTIGEAGSSPYLRFDSREVRLAPHEIQVSEFAVHGDLDGPQHAAIVVEVRNGSVVARAATLVYLVPGPAGALPGITVGLALLLVLAASAGVWQARKRPATPVG